VVYSDRSSSFRIVFRMVWFIVEFKFNTYIYCTVTYSSMTRYTRPLLVQQSDYLLSSFFFFFILIATTIKIIQFNFKQPFYRDFCKIKYNMFTKGTVIKQRGTFICLDFKLLKFVFVQVRHDIYLLQFKIC